MTVYVLLTLESEQVLPSLITTLLKKSVKFSVSKDPNSLCLNVEKPSCCSSQSLASNNRKCPEEQQAPELNKVPKLEVEDTPFEVGQEKAQNQYNDEEYSWPTTMGMSEVYEDPTGDSEGPSSVKKAKNMKQCQICLQWITAKNSRAHAATHLCLSRLKCSACDKTFARKHRGIAHIEQLHNGDATIERTITAEEQAAWDSMFGICFPQCLCQGGCFCNK